MSIRFARGRFEGFGRRSKSLTADYVLEYRNTKLAIIEAKAWEEALTEGVGQAKNYAGKLAIRFTYSTNGQGTETVCRLRPESLRLRAGAVFAMRQATVRAPA